MFNTENKCNRCGQCCLNPTLELRPPQYQFFREEDGWQDLGIVQGNKVVGKNGICTWLDTENNSTYCRIYDLRPTKCRKHHC